MWSSLLPTRWVRAGSGGLEVVTLFLALLGVLSPVHRGAPRSKGWSKSVEVGPGQRARKEYSDWK